MKSVLDSFANIIGKQELNNKSLISNNHTTGKKPSKNE